MKKLLNIIVLVLVLTTTALAQNRCGKPKKNGEPCRNKVEVVGQACHLHGGQSKADQAPRPQCLGTTKAGKRCKKLSNGSGYCFMHENQK